MTRLRYFELRIRGGTAGHACEGATAERAARSWSYANGLATGLVVDVRDEYDRVETFLSVNNDVDRVPA